MPFKWHLVITRALTPPRKLQPIEASACQGSGTSLVSHIRLSIGRRPQVSIRGSQKGVGTRSGPGNTPSCDIRHGVGSAFAGYGEWRADQISYNTQALGGVKT
ncbi:hypothetical protein AGR1C_pAt40211 [Agrobacterium fabacearum TT111]|nr:hypothetical protein AGR1C_pAt40211 [Agrobacterium fabacearum TT111]